jgi:cation diffusion facilitator CzcD-associated flavoprotein CzcO
LSAGCAELDFEVVVVGAGISGIGMGIALLEAGMPSFVLLEAESDLGGTWRDNTYPGIAVDIPASSYCYAFETDYPWSRAFAPGREILAYVQHCAEKYRIRRHVRCGAQVLRTRFDEPCEVWCTELASGEQLTSRYVVAATGLLSQPKFPDIPGLGTFAGKTMHTARWDHSYDLVGRRVACIGTGASAVQIIPEIAPRVAHLSVFQRTPIWISPRVDYPVARGSVLDPRRSPRFRSLARFVSELCLQVLTFILVHYKRLPFPVRILQACLRFLMRRQLRDPALAARLLPDYNLGCKRPTPSNRYLPTFNRDNVSLVTQPIDKIAPGGIVTTDGAAHAADTLVLATGFLTTEKGNAPSFEVFGRSGLELGQFWDAQRLQAYAGVSVPDYPNFFLSAGPYAGGFNWFTMLAANLEHIMACLAEARRRGVTRVEVRRDAHDRYMRTMWQRAAGTLFQDSACRTARSYYIDRHGDASLPLPQTPWWRALRGKWVKTRDYRFGP